MSARILRAAVAGLALAAAIGAVTAPARAADPQTPAPAPSQPATAPGAPKVPTIEDFLASPEMAAGRLSPSGRYIALVKDTDRGQRVLVIDLKERKSREIFGTPAPTVSKGRTTGFSTAGISDIHWKGEDRLVAEIWTFSMLSVSGGVYIGRIPSAWVVPRESSGDGTRISLTKAGAAKPGGAKDDLVVVDALQADPDHVLGFRVADEKLALYKVDVRDNSWEIIEPGAPGVDSYKVNAQGVPVARIVRKNPLFGRGWRVIEGRAPGDAAWSKITEIHSSDLRAFADMELLGAAERPADFYVAVRPKSPADGDTTSVRIYDLQSKTLGPPIWSNPTYDVTGIVQEAGDGGALLAGCYWVDVYQCDFSDKALAANLKGVSKFFENERTLGIVSMSADGKLWLLDVAGPDEPGAYYLYDRASRHVEYVGNRYPKLPTASLGRMTRVDYKARDGLALSGYLTLPPGPTDAPPPPLVVLPHGGPEARDHFEYNVWVQFLASRGYAVFQPNFRGSDGTGRKFAEAGYRKWGAEMEDDITDGVHALIERRKVDGGKVCIMGASYGGYAALYGAVAEPGLYKCVIGISGPSDLVEMLNWERSTQGADSDHYEYWSRVIGDPSADKERLLLKSPARQAAAFRAPVLLLHGTDDQIVPVRQSRIMEKALKQAGRPVRYVEIKGAGHGSWDEESNTKLLSEIETFLDKNLAPARKAPEKPEEKPETAKKGEKG